MRREKNRERDQMEREHCYKYKVFNDWLKDRSYDMEISTAYSFKPLDFLTCCYQDWDSLSREEEDHCYLY